MMVDIDTLIMWLGHEGAKAGLAKSKLSVQELSKIAKQKKLPISQKPSKDEIANELVYHNIKKIQKRTDELVSMSAEELSSYLRNRRPSRTGIIQILASLGITVGSEASKRLVEFAVREISDLGMYQRVARGSHKRGESGQ
jgi:hypothetical protein